MLLFAAAGSGAGAAFAQAPQVEHPDAYGRLFVASCQQYEPSLSRYEAEGIAFRSDGRIVMSGLAPQTMDEARRAHLIWTAAYRASCGEGKPIDLVVTVADLKGTELARQAVSTRFECHGDRTGEMQVWYIC